MEKREFKTIQIYKEDHKKLEGITSKGLKFADTIERLIKFWESKR